MQKTQSGSAHIIIISSLVVVVLVLLGFIFWQNFIPNKHTSATVPTAAVKPTNNSDMIIYQGSGVAVQTVDDVAKLVGAPDSFKNFVTTTMSSAATSQQPCVGDITVDKIYKQAYALGGSCQARVLWVLDSGKWAEAGRTQNDGFVCSDLKQHNVPSEIAGNTCITNDGSGSTPYSQS